MKWTQRLRVASKKNEFTDDDVAAANMWAHCAVGERNGGVEPALKTPLYAWGRAFYEAVRHNRVVLAIAIRKEILRESR